MVRTVGRDAPGAVPTIGCALMLPVRLLPLPLGARESTQQQQQQQQQQGLPFGGSGFRRRFDSKIELPKQYRTLEGGNAT